MSSVEDVGYARTLSLAEGVLHSCQHWYMIPLEATRLTKTHFPGAFEADNFALQNMVQNPTNKCGPESSHGSPFGESAFSGKLSIAVADTGETAVVVSMGMLLNGCIRESGSEDQMTEDVEAYIKEDIRPPCNSGVISGERYRWAVAKTADKVMKHHLNAKNANFQIKEGEKVKQLAEQYVQAAQKKEKVDSL